VWLRPELDARVVEQQTGQHRKPVDKQAHKHSGGVGRGEKQAKTSPYDDIETALFLEYSYKTKR
jgi:hypothetical protein